VSGPLSSVANHISTLPAVCIPRAFTLFGYVFENALKGLIVQRLNTEGQTVVQKRKLQHPLKSHDLIGLAINHAKLSLEPDEKDLLVRLQSFVVWAGRYPVMNDASASVKGPIPETRIRLPTDEPLAAPWHLRPEPRRCLTAQLTNVPGAVD
jgi:hypothetical protein